MKMRQDLLDLAKQLVLGDSRVSHSEDGSIEETLAVDGEMRSRELD